ncbi:MAG TPA: elongation factor G [Nitriliruptorales bacterium]|nr:elongation factor G [Nitriliruptorales bacterium]
MSKDLSVPTDKLRNVLLLGHTGTGKTTLAESLLAAAGVINRRGSTDAGTAALDFEPEEQDRHHSLSLAMAAIPWKGHKINLLDAPGGAEAVGDAYPALIAADVAVFVVDAATGVQPQHEELWAACARLSLPRVVFLNKLDKENAVYQRNIDELRGLYGKALAPFEMPIGVERDFTGVIDLLHFTAVELKDGKRVEEEVPAERRAQAERNREFLVEAIVENDDDLLERYLEGDVPDAKELAGVFARGIARANFFPVLCGAAGQGIGVQMLADFLIEECPSPADIAAARGTSLDGPTAVTIAKTFSDPYVGRINVLRVVRGTLKADDNLVNARTGKELRLHQLFTLQGKDQLPVSTAAAGDVAAVAKLDDVDTGDVLHTRGSEPGMLDTVEPPEPYFRVAVQPASAGDEEKLSTGLARIAEEDRSVRIERDPVTHQLLLRAYGPTHVDVTIKRLQRKFGVGVTHAPPKIAYRETLRGRAQGLGRHVKQTGGHGQYGIAHIEVEPLPRGEGFVFEDAIVGGVIPNQFIPSVEKGVLEAIQRGVLAGYPMVDVKCRLFDGKHHSVDSSDMAFQMAGILAFKDAAEEAGVKLLEPILEVDVSVPDELTGDVMGDLSSRRGRILGTDPAGPGRAMIHAQVPETEMLTYVAELRALTSGRGTVAMRYHHHEDVPEHVSQRIVAEARSAD